MDKEKSEKEISLESIMMNCRNALRGTVGRNEIKSEYGDVPL